jgi:hypothetical protein
MRPIVRRAFSGGTVAAHHACGSTDVNVEHRMNRMIKTTKFHAALEVRGIVVG